MTSGNKPNTSFAFQGNQATARDLTDAIPAKCIYVIEKGDEWQKNVMGLGYQAITDDHGPAPQNCIAAIVEHDADPNLDLCRSLADQHKVILVSDNDQFDFRLTAARAGVHAILCSALGAVDLGGWLTDFDNMDHDAYRILIIDDDEMLSQAYALSLQCAGMIVETVNKPATALRTINQFKPDLVLMDLHMPGISGVELAKIIRQYRRNLSLPIVFLSAERDEERQRHARRIGGDDFISKPVELDKLAELIEIRADRARALRQVMEKDSLTGLLNHARFKDHLNLELARADRTKTPLSIIMIDLDHFKSVNDTYGHQAGDEVIQTLAHSLRGALRRTDIISRYGGEEFAVILLDTPVASAHNVMDKIRSAFANITFEAEHLEYSVTLSAGIATHVQGISADDILKQADDALYQAKKKGRNRVEIAKKIGL